HRLEKYQIMKRRRDTPRSESMKHDSFARFITVVFVKMCGLGITQCDHSIEISSEGRDLIAVQKFDTGNEAFFIEIGRDSRLRKRFAEKSRQRAMKRRKVVGQRVRLV